MDGQWDAESLDGFLLHLMQAKALRRRYFVRFFAAGAVEVAGRMAHLADQQVQRVVGLAQIHNHLCRLVVAPGLGRRAAQVVPHRFHRADIGPELAQVLSKTRGMLRWEKPSVRG